MKILTLLLCFLPLFISCAPVCIKYHTRCHANRVQVCDSEGLWTSILNCDAVIGSNLKDFTCCQVVMDGDIIHACVPKKECNPIIVIDETEGEPKP